jgi:hypothetical protein
LWVVGSFESATIPLKFKLEVRAKLIGNKPIVTPSLVCVEPAVIPTSGVLAAFVLTRVTWKNHASVPVIKTDAGEQEGRASHPQCKDALSIGIPDFRNEKPGQSSRSIVISRDALGGMVEKLSVIDWNFLQTQQPYVFCANMVNYICLPPLTNAR